jgi:hypothetical protein
LTGVKAANALKRKATEPAKLTKQTAREISQVGLVHSGIVVNIAATNEMNARHADSSDRRTDNASALTSELAAALRPGMARSSGASVGLRKRRSFNFANVFILVSRIGHRRLPA